MWKSEPCLRASNPVKQTDPKSIGLRKVSCLGTQKDSFNLDRRNIGSNECHLAILVRFVHCEICSFIRAMTPVLLSFCKRESLWKRNCIHGARMVNPNRSLVRKCWNRLFSYCFCTYQSYINIRSHTIYD